MRPREPKKQHKSGLSWGEATPSHLNVNAFTKRATEVFKRDIVLDPDEVFLHLLHSKVLAAFICVLWFARAWTQCILWYSFHLPAAQPTSNMNTRSVLFCTLSTIADTPRMAHTWYRMQGCAVHRGIKTVGREPSWCRLNSECHKAFAPSYIPS